MTIDHVFDALDVDLRPFALCEIHGNCVLGLPQRSHAVLHYVFAGSGQVTIADWKPISVEKGSLVLVPSLKSHSLSGDGTIGDPLPVCKPLDLSLDYFKEGGVEGGGLMAICGAVDISYRGLESALSLIRYPIIEHLAPDDRVRHSLDEFARELAEPMVGTRALAKTLLHHCMILLLRRRYMEGAPELRWIEALQDERLWVAIQAILDRPEQAHSVDSLAELSLMSRSVFAARFKDALGSGPMEMVRDTRMQKAAQLLANTDVPIKRIAVLVGYESRSYFSRAFQEAYGLSPQAFRAS